MTPRKKDQPDPARLRHIYLARWDNEGGAGPDGPQSETVEGAGAMTNADVSDQNVISPDETASLSTMSLDLANLHVRIIAIESIMISLLAAAPDTMLDKVDDMAAMIKPRAGTSPHPLTERASQHIIDLTKRARHFRSTKHS